MSDDETMEQAEATVASAAERRSVESYCVPENIATCKDGSPAISTHESPSGKYTLTITSYRTGPGTWNYTAGEVRRHGSDEVVARVCRNYSSFWFEWVEEHPNSHDYLFCGSNYQGQTVVECDTGQVADYLPAMAQHGAGFCWVSVARSPSGKYLAVEGCFWAAPYELLIVDIQDPMTMPHLTLVHADDLPFQWEDDDSCWIGRIVKRGEVVLAEGESIDEEASAKYADDDEPQQASEYCIVKGRWRPPSSLYATAREFIIEFCEHQQKMRGDEGVHPDTKEEIVLFLSRLTPAERTQLCADQAVAPLLAWAGIA